MDPNAAKPDNPNIVNPGLEPPVNPSDPLSNLQNVVDAAKAEAAAETATPVQTPQVQFENQFGSGPPTPTPSVAQPSGLDTALADIGTAPPAETAQRPEQTPAETLKQKIAASVDEFLEEVTKEKVTA